MKKLTYPKILKLLTVILLLPVTVSLSYLQDSSAPDKHTSLRNTIAIIDSLNLIGDVDSINSPESRLELGKKVVNISGPINYKIGTARALSIIGNAFHSLEENDSAVYYYKKAYSTIYPNYRLYTSKTKIVQSDSQKAYKSLALTCDIAYNLGKLLSNQYQFDSSYYFLRKSMSIAVKIKDSNTVGNLLNIMGVLAWRRGEFNKAVRLYRTAINYRKHNKDYKLLSKWSNNLGVAYFNLGNYTLALEKYIDAVRYRKMFTEKESSIFINNIGLIHLRLNDLRPAVSYFHHALKIATKDKSLLGIGYSYLNLGEYFAALGKRDSAMANYTKAKIYYGKLNDLTGVAKIYNRCGELYLKNNKIKLAEEKFKKAYKLSNMHSLKLIKTNALINLADVYILKNNFNKAVECLDSAKIIAKENIFERMLLGIYKRQSTVYEDKKRFKTALLYHKKYDELQQKLNDDSKLRVIIEAKEKYRSEQKENQNLQLRRENRIQETQLESKQKAIMYSVTTAIFTFFIIIYLVTKSKEKAKQHAIIVKSKNEIEKINNQLNKINNKLKDSNATKDKFFSIISHDLKNPFNTLLGATQIIRDEYDDLDEKERKEFLEIIYNDSKKLYSLLENLLFWASSQRGKINPIIISLPLYESISEIVSLYISSAEKKNITISIDIPKEISIKFDEFMFSTIIRNLLSNAIKFTFKGGKINFRTETKGSKIHLFIEDNGMGIKKENLEKLFDSVSNFKEVGTDKEKGTGLGLILCHEFVNKNNSTIKVTSTKGKGTTFELVLKKA